MIPVDATCLGVYSTVDLARLHLRQHRPYEGVAYRFRVRWAPRPQWPEHPWAIIAFPWWRRFEADAIDAQGELVWPELLARLWRCGSCSATWERGLCCPNCGTIIPRNEWPELPPAPESTWLTLN